MICVEDAYDSFLILSWICHHISQSKVVCDIITVVIATISLVAIDYDRHSRPMELYIHGPEPKII